MAKSAQSGDETSHARANDACPVNRCAEILCAKWTALILRDLLHGPKHFGELQDSLEGISPPTLSSRLELLQTHDVIHKEIIRAVPMRTVYSLTDKGHALGPVVMAMQKYGTSWLTQGEDC